MNARSAILVSVIGCFAFANAGMTQTPATPSRRGINLPAFHLQSIPAVVYEVDDPGNARTSTFTFEIAVLCSTDCDLTPIAANVELSTGGRNVEEQQWTADMLAKIRRVRHRILPNTSAWDPVRKFTLPESFDFPLYFRCPRALGIDSALVRVTVADAKGHRADQVLRIPIQYYHQKTTLTLPFHGKAVIGQDWITNGGHGGFWNAFAIDFAGLDSNFALQLTDANDNAAAPGWGREILAPAAGTVVYARNDVPNNPHPGEIADSLWNRLPDPIMAYAGNCVIIDHGDSEYSVMMHMQPGSIRVKAGDRVVTGQVVGLLGNSGDAFGPHLHYQLQSGPQLFHDAPLPFRFGNVDVPLRRGTYLDVK